MIQYFSSVLTMVDKYMQVATTFLCEAGKVHCGRVGREGLVS